MKKNDSLYLCPMMHSKPMNNVCRIFNIQHPIISGGMVWCSGWELAAAVSNAGGLGLIGSGSMTPQVLRQHIRRCREATSKPFGVNVPLMNVFTREIMEVLVEERVGIVFTSAGNPATWTPLLKQHGIKVAHVVSNTKFALKAQEAGVDALVAEGFEAGGHNGREETTTLVLLPLVRKHTSLPLIAAGGIASGQAILAVQALGAEGVQIGSLFASSVESSAHHLFKQKIKEAHEGDTLLMLKSLGPVRMLRNAFFEQAREAESRGDSPELLRNLLGRGRARQGMFEGNIEEGQLEIGQVSVLIDQTETVDQIMKRLMHEYREAIASLPRGTWETA